MGRNTDIRKEATTEEAILAAAEKLFIKKGFALTSTTEIARQAGCNQALVHYYFRTKEQLFVSIFSKKLHHFATKLIDIYTPGIPFEDMVCKMVDAHFDILEENPQLPTLIINELMTNPERIRTLREGMSELAARLYTRVAADMHAGIVAGRIREMEPEDLFMDLLSLDAFPFLARPIIKGTFGLDDAGFGKFLKRRREMVKKILINNIRP